jgi:hypothetical protein
MSFRAATLMMMLIFAEMTAITIVSSSEFNATSHLSTFDYQDFALNIAIIAMGVILSILEILVLIKRGQGWGPYSVRIVAVTLIVTAALLALNSNVGASQNVAPLWGLLGTIAGYVLGGYGKDDDSKKTSAIKPKL